MPKRRTPEWLELRARVPRGHEDYWRLIRERCQRTGGLFKLADIIDDTNVHRQSVDGYVRRLVKGGYVSIARTEPGVVVGKVNVYRLQKNPVAAPRLRADGSEISGPAPVQQRLWRAIRSLKVFGVPELAVAATVEGGMVKRKTAQNYVSLLAGAGYLTAAGAARRPQTYRLKMDTGPLSPIVIKLEALWDRNQRRYVGAGEPKAEALS